MWQFPRSDHLRVARQSLVVVVVHPPAETGEDDRAPLESEAHGGKPLSLRGEPCNED